MPMSMVDGGHIVHAKAMFSQTYHLAWGKTPSDYPDPWPIDGTPPLALSKVVTEIVTRDPLGGPTDQLANPGVMQILSVRRGGVAYAPGTDYVQNGRSVDWSPAGAQPNATETYSVTYRYNTGAITEMLAELGRREPTIKSYAYPDVNGDIVANDTTWSMTTEPTRHIYLFFKFDSPDAVGQIIRQVGLFVGTTRKSTVPVGKKYLLPSEIQDPGVLYQLENTEAFSRFAGKREFFEYIYSH